MKFEVYGKQNCGLCDSTKQKLDHIVTKLDVAPAVEVVFVDMDTVMGRAEGAYYDVVDVPTTIARTEDGTELGRWAGTTPDSSEVKDLLAAKV